MCACVKGEPGPPGEPGRTYESELRDKFAAAALTGLISLNHPGPNQQFPQELCERAYRWADAVLRVRDNHIADAGKMVETPGETAP